MLWLAHSGLRVIDLDDLLSRELETITIHYDGHPNVIANGLIADRLLVYLDAMGAGSRKTQVSAATNSAP